MGETDESEMGERVPGLPTLVSGPISVSLECGVPGRESVVSIAILRVASKVTSTDGFEEERLESCSSLSFENAVSLSTGGDDGEGDDVGDSCAPYEVSYDGLRECVGKRICWEDVGDANTMGDVGEVITDLGEPGDDEYTVAILDGKMMRGRSGREGNASGVPLVGVKLAGEGV